MIYSIFFLVLSSLLGVYMYMIIASERPGRNEPNISISNAILAGLVTSLIVAFNMFSIFPFDFFLICTVNCIVSAVVTTQFCSAQVNKFAVFGVFNGCLAGILGTVIGYVSLNPEICGLPGISSDLQNITIIIGVFLCILHCAVAMQIHLSMSKRSGSRVN